MRPFLLLALCAAPVWACDPPPTAPTVPDGAGATKEQLIQAQTDVKTYVAAANEYLACMDKDIVATEDKEAKARLSADYNAVVDQMTATSAQFNTAVQAFKAKGG